MPKRPRPRPPHEKRSEAKGFTPLSRSEAGTSEYGATAEVGYYLTPNLRLAAGYAFGRVSDRDFNNSRSAGGPFLGITVKLDQLFDGFRLLKKKPVPNAPGQKAAASDVAAPRVTPPKTEADAVPTVPALTTTPAAPASDPDPKVELAPAPAPTAPAQNGN